MGTTQEKVIRGSALANLARRMQSRTHTKLSELTNDVGFQTADQVEAAITGKGYQTSAQMEAAINAKVSSTYRAGGSVDFTALPERTADNLGLVVNVTDTFTTTADFVEGPGKTYPAGTNVVVVQVGEDYKLDVLAGFVDMSGYVPKEAGKVLSSNDYTDAEKAKLAGLDVATDAEIDALLDEIFGAGE